MNTKSQCWIIYYLKSDSAFHESVVHCRFSHIVPFYAKWLVAMGSIFNTFYNTSETKLDLYTRHTVHMSCFRIETSIKASYPKRTHLIVVARVPMLMRDNRFLQNFCWMPEANDPLQYLEIIMDVYQTVLAYTSSNYYVFWGIFRPS